MYVVVGHNKEDLTQAPWITQDHEIANPKEIMSFREARALRRKMTRMMPIGGYHIFQLTYCDQNKEA